ncbi:MAG: hypothetical protein IJM83_07110 [Firmicutes bacterium]|nr:hypothetical protein [Bacillota bacterium]
MSKLFAGFGQAVITPDRPFPMAGFDLRKDVATGIHDPLYVRAVWLQTGGQDERFSTGSLADGTSVLFLELDLLGTSDYFCREIEAAVKEEFPEIGEISVGAIHTHAAPQSVFQTLACYDRGYSDWVIRRILEAVSAAQEDIHPVKAAFQETRAQAVGSYRDVSRDESWFSMPVRTIWLDRLEEKSATAESRGPIALTLFACHPTVLNEKNLQISRDLVWGWDEAIRALAVQKGKPVPQVLFMNSACADISTRYTRKEASFREALRMGCLLAEQTDTAPEELEWAEEAVLSHHSFEVTIPAAKSFDEDQKKQVLVYLEQKIETCGDEAQKREYTSCRSVLQRPGYGKNLPLDAKITLIGLDLFVPEDNGSKYKKVIRKDTYVYICLPFEYPQKDAVRFAGEVQMKTGRIALIRCYAGGYEGYLPSGRPLDQDSGYEDMASHYRADAKEILEERIKDELQNLQ